MTTPVSAYSVDLDELGATLTALASCQSGLFDLARDVASAQADLQVGWSGVAADAQLAAYDGWRDACADMVLALAGLRGVASAADQHYHRAVDANLALWAQVAP